MSYEIILGTGIAAVGGLACWNVALHFMPYRETVYHDDVERTEAYVFTHQHFDFVMVGSGLIGHLRPSLDKPWFNLSFPYYGSCTGLEIIALSGKFPRMIFVETNFLFKGINERLVRNLFGNRTFQIKRTLPIFQKKNNPGKFFRNSFARMASARAWKRRSHPEKSSQTSMEGLFELFDRPPNEAKLRHDLDVMKRNVDMLSYYGCRIFFFQVPVDPLLFKTRTFQSQHAEIGRAFPKDRYQWIAPDTAHAYQTQDGLHLTPDSLEAFTNYLNSEIKKIAIQENIAS